MAQYYSNPRTYKITLLNGNPQELVKAGDVSAQFDFEGIGVNWNMKTENEYLRFKILHRYILDGRKEGEHWKRKYSKAVQLVYEDFNIDMERYLRKRKIQISTAFNETPVKLIVSFVDKSENINYENYGAYFRFVNVASGSTIALYYIEENRLPTQLYGNQRNELQMRDLTLVMARHFKKHLKG